MYEDESYGRCDVSVDEQIWHHFIAVILFIYFSPKLILRGTHFYFQNVDKETEAWREVMEPELSCGPQIQGQGLPQVV